MPTRGNVTQVVFWLQSGVHGEHMGKGRTQFDRSFHSEVHHTSVISTTDAPSSDPYPPRPRSAPNASGGTMLEVNLVDRVDVLPLCRPVTLRILIVADSAVTFNSSFGLGMM